MRITTKDTSQELDNISKLTYLSNKNFLIFDIETTGFSREYEIIYMIGCIYNTDKGYEYCNIFAETPSEEYELISYFFKILKNIDCVVHFNGNRFDIPFLRARASYHAIKDQISHIESIDIYDLLRPFRKSLDLPNLKLDTIQDHLGYKRKDTYTGGDLIQVYKNYVRKPYEPYYELLLLHNREDVEGMINLLSIIDIMNLIDQIMHNQSVEVLEVLQTEKHIKILYQMPSKVLIDFKLFSSCNAQIILSAHSDQAKFILPLHEDEKRFFFENYKDYMYIPDEDKVMHKSIASFIPSHKKQKVSKRDCYIAHEGIFMPLFYFDFKSSSKLKIFKDHLRSKESYILASSELDNEFYKGQVSGFLIKCKGL